MDFENCQFPECIDCSLCPFYERCSEPVHLDEFLSSVMEV